MSCASILPLAETVVVVPRNRLIVPADSTRPPLTLSVTFDVVPPPMLRKLATSRAPLLIVALVVPLLMLIRRPEL